MAPKGFYKGESNMSEKMKYYIKAGIRFYLG